MDANMSNINDVERWLSLEEIAKHVGCSKDTIRVWIKKGTIPYELNVSYRTVHRIHASALNNFVVPE